ncbi:MAG TPA: D-alanyl-D-alanine carboxypeptidase/D-alanyl-D-alanine-endopeptidase [Bryobacteraceae bacterium]|nr:D-alanyl-D-alanine carboxypeptidase/D-alanyl-D-alanine-endopeptidase [Bryobacteraceae bacterium]
MRSLAFFVLLPFFARAQPLAQRMDALTRSTPAASQAFWGIRVVDLATGKAVFEKNADSFFVPASNTKLFTSALALMRLGPSHQFHTRIVAPAPDASGRVHGDLGMIGGGDPNLSARVLPYRKDEFGPDPLAAVNQLASEIVKHGVREIDGDIVGDDTAFVWDAYPDGWSIDDAVWEYGAPVSALTLNDNAFTLQIAPGHTTGAPARLSLSPPLEHLTIQNRVHTIASGDRKLRFQRLPGSRELIVSGTLPLDDAGTNEVLAVEDPALFAAHALKEALEARGVIVRGRTAVRHRSPGEPPAPFAGEMLAELTSQPLIEILRVLAKESQNLHTELVLREVARVVSGNGSLSEGLQQLRQFLTEAGIGEKQYHFDDASGLSRKTLVTPMTVSKLLTYMYGSKLREEWTGILPVGGVDGTLAKRFRTAHGPEIHAKTGTISHVTALSGYVLPAAGRRYAFSILVNNFNAEAPAIRAVTDKIVLTLFDRN